MTSLAVIPSDSMADRLAKRARNLRARRLRSPRRIRDAELFERAAEELRRRGAPWEMVAAIVPSSSAPACIDLNWAECSSAPPAPAPRLSFSARMDFFLIGAVSGACLLWMVGKVVG